MMTTATPKTAWYRELHWQIALGLGLGLAFSLVMRAVFLIPMPVAEGLSAASLADLTEKHAESVALLDSVRAPFGFVGDLFLRLLKLIVIPLILVSIISAIQKLGDIAELGRLGIRTLLYYLFTTFAAVTIGLVVVNVVQPGVGLGLEVAGEASVAPKPLLEVFRDIVPSNMFAALANGQMLPTIFVSILVGLALLTLGEEGNPLRKLVEGLNALVFRITDWAMRTAPIGVGALFVNTLLDPKLADLTPFFTNLGSYSFAVVLGLGFHAIVLLPIVLWIVTKRTPLSYARALSPSLLTAFSTASSSATYPVTLDCVTERAEVNPKAADFVLPLGATINMDGTALYEAVAAVFIANAIGVDLTFADQLVIVITATLAAIGAAGVPSAGLVTMVVVLESVGLPAAGYVLVIAVDRVLDMCRTTVNVWGDAIGAAVVGKMMDDIQ